MTTGRVMKRHELVASRDMLTRVSVLACNVVDDESQPNAVRDEAASVQFWLSEMLCYQNQPATPFRLIPVGMKVAQFFTHLVDELILDLGGELVEELWPAYCQMAPQAAKMAYDGLYSAEFRLDAYDAMNTVLAGLKRYIDDVMADDTAAERITADG